MAAARSTSSVSLNRRRTLRVPVTLSVILMTLNVALMVCWIILLARIQSWSALTVGTVVFALILSYSKNYDGDKYTHCKQHGG